VEMLMPGWGICKGKEGEFGREGGMEERNDSHTLRNLRTSMWLSRYFPILGQSSVGNWDQSTFSSMAEEESDLKDLLTLLKSDIMLDWCICFWCLISNLYIGLEGWRV